VKPEKKRTKKYRYCLRKYRLSA